MFEVNSRTTRTVSFAEENGQVTEHLGDGLFVGKRVVRTQTVEIEESRTVEGPLELFSAPKRPPAIVHVPPRRAWMP